MSLGSEAPSEGRLAMPPPTNKRPVRGHGRSASLQVTYKPPPLPSPHVNTGSASYRQPSPLYESFTPAGQPGGQNGPPSLQPPRKRHGTVSADFTPRAGGHRRSPSAMSGGAYRCAGTWAGRERRARVNGLTPSASSGPRSRTGDVVQHAMRIFRDAPPAASVLTNDRADGALTSLLYWFSKEVILYTCYWCFGGKTIGGSTYPKLLRRLRDI